MAKQSNVVRRPCVEAMESRLFCDAAQLTEVVTSAPFSHVLSTASVAGKATVTVTNPGDVEKEKVEIGIFASETPLSPDGPTASNYDVGFIKANLNMPAGATKTFKVPIRVHKGGVPNGVYTLYAIVGNYSGATSLANTGPTLTVAPPDIQLTPTEMFAKLPARVAAGARTSASAKVTIVNHGADASVGPTTAAVYLSTDGTIINGTLVNSVAKTLKVAAHRVTKITLPLKKFPLFAAGTYTLVTQVTDPNGVSTTSNAVTIVVDG